MKKIFLLTVILATMLTMFGCAPAATPAPAATQAPAAKAKTYAD